MEKEEFQKRRTEIISKMLDNPGQGFIYPTTECFKELDELFDALQANATQQEGYDLAAIKFPIDDSMPDAMKYNQGAKREGFIEGFKASGQGRAVEFTNWATNNAYLHSTGWVLKDDNNRNVLTTSELYSLFLKSI